MKTSHLAVLVAAALSLPAYAIGNGAAESVPPPMEAESMPAPMEAEAGAPAMHAEPAEASAPAMYAEEATGSVARADFTSEVVDREPVDSVDSLTTDVQRVAFFTELEDMEGQTITHVWEYQGEIMAEVPFTVGGPRWRVWSSKNMMPEWTGEWTVSVLNGSGELLDQDSFQYVEGDAASTVGHEMDAPRMEGRMEMEGRTEMEGGMGDHQMTPGDSMPMGH